MISTHPQFPVRVLKITGLDCNSLSYVVQTCPRCGCNIGINSGMRAGIESIICKGKLGAGLCNGHYYLRGNRLEFVGTAKGE